MLLEVSFCEIDVYSSSLVLLMAMNIHSIIFLDRSMQINHGKFLDNGWYVTHNPVKNIVDSTNAFKFM